MNQVTFNGLTYNQYGHTSFLSHNQLQYALENLWRLVAGDAKWENQAAITFTAITKDQVDEMLKLPPDSMPWIHLEQILPQGIKHHFDTQSLPAICLTSKTLKPIYNSLDVFPLDLVAATFILLTRWEEWKYPELDEYGRHREDSMLCARQNFRERPVLDEWAMVIRAWLQTKNPAWKPQLPKPSIWITHDIDHLQYYKDFTRLYRGIIRDTFKKKSINNIFSNITAGLNSLLKDPRQDPCFKTIIDLMEMDESLGLKGTFFFMSASPSAFDEGYNLNSPNAQDIISLLQNHDHEIGWHPGYFAAKDDPIFKKELENILRNTQKTSIGARHHYLRWNAATSWKRMADTGITYDSSLGYNHHLGFRASTATFYPAYDLLEDKVLPLEVRPFAAMDGVLLKNTQLANLSRLMQRVHSVNGCFAIIIHNYTVMINPIFVQSIYSLIENETQH